MAAWDIEGRPHQWTPLRRLSSFAGSSPMADASAEAATGKPREQVDLARPHRAIESMQQVRRMAKVP